MLAVIYGARRLRCCNVGSLCVVHMCDALHTYDVFDNPGGLIMSRVASRSFAMLY